MVLDRRPRGRSCCSSSDRRGRHLSAASTRGDRWQVVHVGTLIFIPLMAVAVFLLLRGLESTAAQVSRVAAVIFVVFYGAWEVLQGIGVGILTQRSTTCPKPTLGQGVISSRHSARTTSSTAIPAYSPTSAASPGSPRWLQPRWRYEGPVRPCRWRSGCPIGIDRGASTPLRTAWPGLFRRCGNSARARPVSASPGGHPDRQHREQACRIAHRSQSPPRSSDAGLLKRIGRSRVPPRDLSETCVGPAR